MLQPQWRRCGLCYSPSEEGVTSLLVSSSERGVASVTVSLKKVWPLLTSHWRRCDLSACQLQWRMCGLQAEVPVKEMWPFCLSVPVKNVCPPGWSPSEGDVDSVKIPVKKGVASGLKSQWRRCSFCLGSSEEHVTFDTDPVEEVRPLLKSRWWGSDLKLSQSERDVASVLVSLHKEDVPF